MMISLRIAFTRFLIRLAMKTCVMGFCYDYLSMALRSEEW